MLKCEFGQQPQWRQLRKQQQDRLPQVSSRHFFFIFFLFLINAIKNTKTNFRVLWSTRVVWCRLKGTWFEFTESGSSNTQNALVVDHGPVKRSRALLLDYQVIDYKEIGKKFSLPCILSFQSIYFNFYNFIIFLQSGLQAGGGLPQGRTLYDTPILFSYT